MVSREAARLTLGLAARLGVPDDVALVYEFVNSLDLRAFTHRGHRNLGGDELASVGGLRAWLGERKLIVDADPVSAADLAVARVVRARLRAAIAAHGGPGGLGGESGVLDRRLPLDVVADPGGRLGLRPRSSGARGALGLVLVEAVSASAAGRWPRLKICGATDCRWVFFDASKPGTARWCETEICGNRVKKANQRARRDAITPALE